MTDTEFLRLKAGSIVCEETEQYELVSLNSDNTSTLKRLRDEVCGKVLDTKLIGMELVKE